MRSMLTDMRLLKRYSKGTELLTTPTKSGGRASMPGAHWPVYIYTHVPESDTGQDCGEDSAALSAQLQT